MGIKRLSLLIVLLASSTLRAQVDTSTISVYKGQSVRYFQVTKGKTLYNISRTFGLSQDSLISLNPELEKGLKTGMYIRIPVKAPTSRHHTVKPKETLFSIAKQYGVSVDQLKTENPSLKGDLQAGMVLKIPAEIPPEIKKDSTPTPAPILQVEEKIACRELSASSRKLQMKVVFLLPFQHSPDQEFNTRSRIALEFYCGAKLALDSLERKGIGFEVSVFDTESDTIQASSLLTKKEIAEADLIVGPLYSSVFRPIAEFAAKKKICAISPFSQSDAILEGLPNVAKVTPDQHTVLELLAGQLAERYPQAEFYLLKNSNEKDRHLAASIRSGLEKSRKGRFTELTWRGISALTDSLSTSKENIVFFPSTLPVQVIDLTSKLQNHRHSRKITLVGLNEWNTYENIDYDHLNNLNFTWASPGHNQTDLAGVRRFREAFRDEYKGEPGNYAFQGFDIALYFGDLLWTYGKNFGECLDKVPLRCGLNSCYRFQRDKKENGWENRFVNVLQLDDFEARRINTAK